MSLHGEVLTERQRKALRLLGPKSAADGFYLAGGTAIALHLGHRRSVDLDWFLEGRIPDPLRFAQEIRDGGVPFGLSRIPPELLIVTEHDPSVLAGLREPDEVVGPLNEVIGVLLEADAGFG